MCRCAVVRRALGHRGHVFNLPGLHVFFGAPARQEVTFIQRDSRQIFTLPVNVFGIFALKHTVVEITLLNVVQLLNTDCTV